MALDDGEFGRYRIVAKIGQGGMGQVFRAFDTLTNREVALKVLPSEFADNTEFRTRFQREADLVAGLREPHIVPIHGFGEIEGRLFLDMRLIDGVDARSMLESQGPMSPERAIGIIDQVAAALDAAHSVGLEHRDVKPENILVAHRDFVYLIDFGIARAVNETGLTRTGLAVGTFAYMAPERFGGNSDHRSDVYALTCVLYELLTGAAPFPGNSMEQLIAAHLHESPPKPTERQPSLPASINNVISHGMAKAPDLRYRSAGELADAARQALTGSVGTPSGDGLAPATVLSGEVASERLSPVAHDLSHAAPVEVASKRRSKPRHWLIGGVGVVVLVVIALAVGLVVTRTEAGSPSAPEASILGENGGASHDGSEGPPAPGGASQTAQDVEIAGFTQVGTDVSVRLRNPNRDLGLIRTPFEATLLGESGEILATVGQGGLPGAIVNTIYQLPPGGEYGISVAAPGNSKVASVEVVTLGTWHEWPSISPPEVTVKGAAIADQSSTYGPGVTGRITLDGGVPSNIVVMAYVRTPKGTVVSNVIVDCVKAAQPRAFQTHSFSQVSGPFALEKVLAYPTAVEGVEPSYKAC
ncbi:serine/threonine-protein kinase [Gordonia hongkongensis]|uniref:serine/threonine-protein kinase n=1 Tax=Gordonia hongkongensis TaxID=1701090 RepID=UPI001FF94C6B|nr:serine/threonine-protein kinase [Gordonia hongkongensis]UPG67692.1 serine/threonine protein kinase [Gordonia hongkongensis]